MGVPQVPSPEVIRSQLAGLLTKMGGSGQKTPRAGTSTVQLLPSASSVTGFLPTGLLRQVPANVVRALVHLQEAGIPLDFLNAVDAGAKGGRAGPYVSSRDQGEPRTQVVSGLLRAVDNGAVTAEELNAFLSALAVPAESVRRALTQVGRSPDSERITLNDAVYRLVSGRLVAAEKRATDNTARFWLNTTVVVAALLLLAAAVIRF